MNQIALIRVNKTKTNMLNNITLKYKMVNQYSGYLILDIEP